MGDPKFCRRKYSRPSHPWQAERIKMEHELVKKYGLKNKRELWRSQSFLRRLRRHSRIIHARLRAKDAQAEKESKELIKKCIRLGLLPENASLDDVLGLDVEVVLGRRLQTLVYIKGLAYTPKHARQLIVHGHIAIGGRKVTVPGYIVKKDEEEDILYHEYSPFADEMHPMRPKDEVLRARMLDSEHEKKKVKIDDKIVKTVDKLKKDAETVEGGG